MRKKLTVHLGLRLDEDTFCALSNLARDKGVSTSDLGRHAIFLLLPRWLASGVDNLVPTRKPRTSTSTAPAAPVRLASPWRETTATPDGLNYDCARIAMGEGKGLCL